MVSIALAAAFPSVGRKGGPLRPELTIAWGATSAIFWLAGLNLPTAELARAAMNVRVHALIQTFNLALMPLATIATCNALAATNALAPIFCQGLLVMNALPTTVNQPPRAATRERD